MKPIERPVFTALEIDAIGEIMNISLGSCATSLSSMLDKEVTVSAPEVKILISEELDIKRYEPAFGAEVNCTSAVEKKSVMVFKRSDIKAIIDMLSGTKTADDDLPLDDMDMSAATEFINHMMSTASFALGEFLGTAVEVSTPVCFEIENEQTLKDNYYSASQTLVTVDFRLLISEGLHISFLYVMTAELARQILSHFSQGKTDLDIPDGDISNSIKTTEAPVDERRAASVVHSADAQDIRLFVHQQPDIPADSHGQAQNLDLIMSVPLQVSVEIGRTRKQVKELLEFTQGTLVELDKLAGDQADVFVNGQCIAKGDVVVIDDCFGVRITEIIKKDGFKAF